MLALRGRRQVGKSTLVEEFIQGANVPAVFFVASKQTGDRELALFGEAIAASTTDAAEVARAGGMGS
jgi:AAA+ ATPase superfamily predicted ATPase